MPFLGRHKKPKVKKQKPRRDTAVKCGRTWTTKRESNHTHQCRLNRGHSGAHICTFCTKKTWRND